MGFEHGFMRRVKTLPCLLLGGRDKALISWGVGIAPQYPGKRGEALEIVEYIRSNTVI